MLETYIPASAVATGLAPSSTPSMQATALPRWQVDSQGTSGAGTATFATRSTLAAMPAAPGESYRLIERVGSGGMGEVWSALQATLERPVAVKRLLPKRLLDDPDSLGDAMTEFRLEAMVAGRLEHPNIVPIHDLGADAEGLPLIAMKLVEGNNWCDKIAADFESMSAPDFLGKNLPILVNMTHAVAFAHDRGIVHRDLKPAQVMVGGFGEVLLMDWGLAVAWKDTTRKGAPALALPTPANAINPAGTPALMAPEQTDPDAIRIGPHTDIFLLGATLYFLLTGTYPYQASSSKESFLKAMVIDQERPETRAPQRWIPKELADIAMKAMEPEMGYRFASAGAFREAIADWMTGAAQRREAQALLDAAGTTLDRTPTSYVAFDRVLHQLDRAGALWPDQPFVQALSAQAREGYARLALSLHDLNLARAQASGLDDATRRDALTNDIDAAARAFQLVATQRRWAIRGIIGLFLLLVVSGGVFIYRLDQSRRREVAAREESDRQRTRADDARGEAESLVRFMVSDLADKLKPLGRLDVMDAVLIKIDDMLATRNEKMLSSHERRSVVSLSLKMSEVRHRQGNLPAAESAARRAIEMTELLIAEDPDNTRMRRELGTSLDRLGDVLVNAGRLEEALELFLRSSATVNAIAESDPTRTRWQADVAYSWFRIGDVYERQGRKKEALEAYEKNRELTTRLVATEPNVDEWQDAMQLSNNQMASIYQARGDYLMASSLYEEARKIAERRAARFPNDVGLQRDLAAAGIRRAGVAQRMKKYDDARRYFDAALASFETLLAGDPTNQTWRREYCVALASRAELYDAEGDLAKNIELLLKVTDMTRSLIAENPTSVELRTDLTGVLSNLADNYERAGNIDGARASFVEWNRLCDELLSIDPGNIRRRRNYGISLRRHGAALIRWKELDAAESIAQRAIEVLEPLNEPDYVPLKNARNDLEEIATLRAK